MIMHVFSGFSRKPGVLLTGLLILAGFVFLSAPASAQSTNDDDVIDEVVAVIDDEIILRSEVDGLVQNMARQRETQPDDRMWFQALNQVVNQQVLASYARQDTLIEVSAAQVEQAMDRQIGQMVQQVGGEEQLEQMYGQSILQIREDLRDDFRNQLLAQRVQQTRMQSVRITPSEVEEWFRQFPEEDLPELPDIVRVAHIVKYPTPSPAAEEEAREIITTLRDSVIVGGAEFEDLARQFSDDQGSARDGGRYADYEVGDLVPEFGAVAARLPVGEISEPFRTQFGYHIMRVNNRRGDQVDFNHILIQVDERSADIQPALDELAVLRDSIETHNQPFDRMARRHSEEERSSEFGGRVLDPQTNERDLFLDRLDRSWQRTIRNLEPGEISEPREVELLDGTRAAHIVKLQRFTPAHRVNLETDYERIREFALQDKRARRMEQWISQLRDEMHVEFRGKAARLKSELPDDVLETEIDPGDMEATPPAQQGAPPQQQPPPQQPPQQEPPPQEPPQQEPPPPPPPPQP